MRHLVAFTCLLTFVSLPVLCAAQAPARQMRSMHMPEQALAEDNEIFLSYWTVEPDWHSELQLRNNSVSDPLIVTPVLRSGGEEFSLPAVTIAPQDTAVVNLHEALGALKRPIPQPFGSVILRFHSAYPRQLYAAAMLHRESRAIAFHVDGAGKLIQPSTPTTKEGIWWLPTDTISDTLVLTNQGSDATSVQIRLTNASGTFATVQVNLAPRQTLRKPLRELLAQQHIEGTFGGIQIRPLAHAEAIDALAFAIDEQLGFGAILKMFDRDPSASVAERDFVSSSQFTLRAPMLALASADPNLAMPVGTQLHPLIFVRNVADHNVSLNIQFNWTGDTWTGTTKGPSVTLGPRETRLIRIESLPESQKPPIWAHWASVYLTSTDSLPDDVLAVAASYDSSFRYGTQTPFSDQLSSVWKGGEWQYDGLHDSIITIGNATSTPTKALFTLFYNHASSRYQIEKVLGSNEQMWIDVGTLIRNRVPDKNGSTLPSNITTGSYEFRDLSTPSRPSLFEGKVIYDKTNGHASYGCADCCAARSVYLNYNPLYVATHNSFTNGVSDTDDCGDGPEDISNYFYNWSTQSTAIATTTSQGTHTGIAPGGTTSFTNGQVLHTNGRNGCYYINAQEQGPTNTIPSISYSNLKDLALGNTGSQNAITSNQVTATGDPSGGTYSWSASNSNITLTNTSGAVVTTTASAVGASVLTVTYTVNGLSNSANATVNVFQPSSVAILSDPGVTATHSCYSGTSQYNGPSRDVQYQIQASQGSNTVPVTADVSLTESFTTLSSPGPSCGPAPSPTQNLITNQTFTDHFDYCSTNCLPAVNNSPTGSCTLALHHIWTANGFSIFDHTLNYTCTNITPQ